jgi:hypothetical protein
MPIRALPIGKIAPALLEKLIADATRIEPTQIKTEVSSEFGANMARHLDSGIDSGIAARTDILLGPGIGEDACALSIAGGALVAAMDPITMTGRGVGRHAVIINANDVAVTGVNPQWFLATILVPVFRCLFGRWPHGSYQCCKSTGSHWSNDGVFPRRNICAYWWFTPR